MSHFEREPIASALRINTPVKGKNLLRGPARDSPSSGKAEFVGGKKGYRWPFPPCSAPKRTVVEGNGKKEGRREHRDSSYPNEGELWSKQAGGKAADALKETFPFKKPSSKKTDPRPVKSGHSKEVGEGGAIVILLGRPIHAFAAEQGKKKKMLE